MGACLGEGLVARVRAPHMARVLSRRKADGATGKFVKNLAVPGRTYRGAEFTQPFELPLQFPQFADAARHMLDVLFEQVINCAAVFRWSVPELKQQAYFLERHVERTAMADEPQALGVLVAVKPIVADGSARLGQQPRFFVIAYGLDPAIGAFGEFPYVHVVLDIADCQMTVMCYGNRVRSLQRPPR